MNVPTVDEAGAAFDSFDIGSVLPSGMASPLRWLMCRFLCARQLNRVVSRVFRGGAGGSVFGRILDALDVRFEAAETDLARIPRKGPVVVVSNHPFGAVEGVVLAALLGSVRPDVKIMANHLLRGIPDPEFLEGFIFVDPFGTRAALRSNVRPLRECSTWLKTGGLLGIFPAGEVAHFDLRRRELADAPWPGRVARFIRNSGASVVPVFFPGTNSALFHLSGLVHPKLRTLLLPREMLKKRGAVLEVRMGGVIPPERIAAIEDDVELAGYLRLRSHVLGKRGEDAPKRLHLVPRRVRMASRPVRPMETVVPPVAPELITAEVLALPSERRLVDSPRFSVHMAEAPEIPNLLREIGRLREITFREVDEGTGKAIDLDVFDETYLHLFLWDKQAGRVAGGYRMGRTDLIMERQGKHGLYTSTLFGYGRRFVDRISPALELGRSFVRLEYQKTYQPLLLLWKAIGRFVAENPRYRYLFGPVSINNAYHSISRELIVAFARANRSRHDLLPLVRGRGMPVFGGGGGGDVRIGALLRDVQDLSEVVSDIERDHKGVPILYKHYMNLGGEFLGFAVDRNFNDALDVFILVDLTQTSPRLLERYMGKADARSYLARWNGGGGWDNASAA